MIHDSVMSAISAYPRIQTLPTIDSTFFWCCTLFGLLGGSIALRGAAKQHDKTWKSMLLRQSGQEGESKVDLRAKRRGDGRPEKQCRVGQIGAALRHVGGR